MEKEYGGGSQQLTLEVLVNDYPYLPFLLRRVRVEMEKGSIRSAKGSFQIRETQFPYLFISFLVLISFMIFIVSAVRCSFDPGMVFYAVPFLVLSPLLYYYYVGSVEERKEFLVFIAVVMFGVVVPSAFLWFLAGRTAFFFYLQGTFSASLSTLLYVLHRYYRTFEIVGYSGFFVFVKKN